MFLAHGAHLDEVDQRAHLMFDGIQTDEAVELFHQLVKRLFLLFGLRFRLFFIRRIRLFISDLRLVFPRNIDAPRRFLRAVIMPPGGAGHQECAQPPA